MLQLVSLYVLPFSGRPLIPYFETLEYYDYVVKGEVIARKEISHYQIEVGALQIKIIDKLGQEIADTVWVTPIIIEGAYPNFNYEELSEQCYFAFKSNDNGLYYDPSDPYFLLEINNDTVSSLFTYSDIFFNRLLHLHSNKKMKTEKFEKKLKQKLNRQRSLSSSVQPSAPASPGL